METSKVRKLEICSLVKLDKWKINADNRPKGQGSRSGNAKENPGKAWYNGTICLGKTENVDCDDKDFPMPGLDNQMTRSYPCWAPVHKNQREINDPTLLWDKIFQPIPSHLLAKSDPRKYGENWIGSTVQSVSWIFVRSTIVTCLIFSIPFAIRGRGHHVCLASQLS